jgi:hypothetical protein
MSVESNAGRPQARRPHARARARLLGAAALLSAALLLGGCGAAAKHSSTTTGNPPSGSASTATTTPATTTSLASTTGAASHSNRRTTAARNVAPSPIAFSRCMRANGVTDFPDPTPGKGFGFQVSASVSASPSFQQAQSKCQRLVMGGDAAFQSNPSRQTMAKLLKIANCMRAHGVHQFPDPLYTRPTRLTPREYQEITDFDGATLLFPVTMNLQAPAYRQALAACDAPPLGLPH